MGGAGGLAVWEVGAEFVLPHSLIHTATVILNIFWIVRAEQVETDEPVSSVLVMKTRESSVSSLSMTVVEAPPATDFEDILKDVDGGGRGRTISDATTFSDVSLKLSQRWRGALGFASAVSSPRLCRIASSSLFFLERLFQSGGWRLRMEGDFADS